MGILSSLYQCQNNVDAMIERLLKCCAVGEKQQFPLSTGDIQRLCWDASELFICQPALLRLHPLINICGGVNGQYHNLLKLLEIGGHPRDTNYVFLGNYVDNCFQNLLTMCLLLAYKVKHPNNFFILRGDHESSSSTASQALRNECKGHTKYLLWDHFVECFDSMPVAAVICEKIFCVHGGISPCLLSLGDINNISRPVDIPDNQLVRDLLCSKPDPSTKGWTRKKGDSFAFGPDKVTEFLKKYDLKLMCRGGQVVKDGYSFFADNQLITIFSSPKSGNVGAILSIDQSLNCSIRSYGSVVSGESSTSAGKLQFSLSSMKTRIDVEESPGKKKGNVVAEDKLTDEDFHEIELIKKQHANEQKQTMELVHSLQQENAKLLESKLKNTNQLRLAQNRISTLSQDLASVLHDRNRLQLELDSKVEELRAQKDQIPVYEFSPSELQQATNNFSDLCKIGQGGFAVVYRGTLRGITVAIKKLRPENQDAQAAFRQEVAILSRVRGPNLVNVIGVCSEAYMLVYEFLENGSLEDRLTCKNNTPKLKWEDRTRIIAETRNSLIFLHSARPQPVVHGDLKPDNILLDANFKSKLGDFGICRFLSYPTTGSANYYTENPRGTPGYIDPEFITTGELTAKSDVYSFGIIILRLLTGIPALNIAELVEKALDSGKLRRIVDQSAGNWPRKQAKILANLGVKCARIIRKQRLDLVGDDWTEFEEKCC